jgi:hypothetical protein
LDKHILYFELLDGLELDECPICHLINKRIDQFIDGFLYESVNDPKIREDIDNAKGYCNYHAWKLQSAGDPLAHSIIYGDLVRNAIKSFQEFLMDTDSIANERKSLFNKGKDSKVVRLRGSFFSEKDCPICEMVAESENEYVLSLGDYMESDAEFQRKFQENGFLCVPHLIKLLENYEGLYTIREIIKVQVKKMAGLLNNLNEIKRKSDYRYAAEPMSDEEKTAWIKAVKKYVGEPGIQK